MHEAPAPSQPTASAPYPAPPTALRVAFALILIAAVCTPTAVYLDYHSAIMRPPIFLPRTPRDICNVLGAIGAIGAAVATLRGINWARLTLAVACFLYAVPHLATAIFAGYILTVGPRAFFAKNFPGVIVELPPNIVSMVATAAAVSTLIFLTVTIGGMMLVLRTCRTYTLAMSRQRQRTV